MQLHGTLRTNAPTFMEARRGMQQIAKKLRQDRTQIERIDIVVHYKTCARPETDEDSDTDSDSETDTESDSDSVIPTDSSVISDSDDESDTESETEEESDETIPDKNAVSLSKFGYTMVLKLDEPTRRAMLNRAILVVGKKRVMSKMAFLKGMNDGKPAGEIFKQDYAWCKDY